MLAKLLWDLDMHDLHKSTPITLVHLDQGQAMEKEQETWTHL